MCCELWFDTLECRKCRNCNNLAVGRAELVTGEDVSEKMRLKVVVVLRTEVVVERLTGKLCLDISTFFQGFLCIIPKRRVGPRLTLYPSFLGILQHFAQDSKRIERTREASICI